MVWRLTRHITMVLILLWLVAVAGAGIVVKAEMDEVFDGVLSEGAQHMLADILERQRDQLDAMRPGDPPLVPVATPHEEYITWQLLAADGRLLAHSHGAPTVPFVRNPEPGFVVTPQARLYVEPSPDQRFIFLLAEPAAHRSHAIRSTLLQLLLPMGLLIAGTLLLVPVAVRSALQPVRQLQIALEQRGGSNLTEIGALGLPRELHPIRQDVNLLLRRLRQALEAERNFNANAAHELRTPVAAAMAHAQLLAQRLPVGEEGSLQATAIAEELRRLGRRVEKLLQLGRAEAGVALRADPIDLLMLLQLCIDELPNPERVHLRLCGLETLMVRADIDMLGIALRNLLENALLHGDTEHPVEVIVGASGELSVVNGGRPLSERQLAALSERFVRHGSALGSGLGLAIVRAIAEQSGGSLQLFSPARGRADGFEAMLRLPLAAARSGVG